MAMAPMANVTDAAFRRMFAKFGPPDVFWTEFVSVEGLLSRGRDALLVDFWKSDDEHPIVAQIFGSKPEQFEQVAELVNDLGFDGIDINMGCPDRGVEKSCAGAALIKDPKLAKEIIRATKRGAGNLPVSVKTRIGYAKNEIDSWIGGLLEEDLAALTVHLRTRNEMSDVPAHWDLAPQIVALRDRIVGQPTSASAPSTIILGNGDVETFADAQARVAASGMDGAMIGRGIFGNPWFFNKTTGGQAPGTKEKLAALIEHAQLFETLYKSTLPKRQGGLKNFDIMKKHFKAYCSGFDGAKELRIMLMETENAAEVEKIIQAFILRL